MSQADEKFYLAEKAEENQITIMGFRKVKLADINRFLEQSKNADAAIQFFDAHHVAGQQHLYFAAVNALNAFSKKRNISNSLAVEALLYASAQRQINKAVEMLGIKPDSSEVAVLIIAPKGCKTDYTRLVNELVPGQRDDSVLELSNSKIDKIRELYGISELELESQLKQPGREKDALVNLVIERMALLNT